MATLTFYFICLQLLVLFVGGLALLYLAAPPAARAVVRKRRGPRREKGDVD
jgi:hypothetical protein